MQFDDNESDRLDGVPHPRRATTLIGHADEECSLLLAYRQNRLPQALLIGGTEGIGKATLAWRLAKFLVVNPLHTSSAVVEAETLAVAPDAKAAAEAVALCHPDIALLRREPNERTGRFYSEIRADDVRRTISLFQRQAGAGGYRICIVDSAEDLNRSSANALLKLIEEPPPKSLFLILAHRPGLVMPTIRSRTRLLRLRNLLPDEIVRAVGTLGAPWSLLPRSGVEAAASRAEGSVREALRRLGDGDLDRRLAALLGGLPLVDWRELHALADQLGGRNGEAVLAATLDAAHDWLAAQLRAQPRPDVRTGLSAPAVPAATPSAASLVAYAEAWGRIGEMARDAQALNLDKRSLVFAVFSDLAAAARHAAQTAPERRD